MAVFRGTVKKNDLEGGIWELHAEDGKRYQLQGGDDALRTEGGQGRDRGQDRHAGLRHRHDRADAGGEVLQDHHLGDT